MTRLNTERSDAHWYYPDGTPCHEVPYADPSKGMRKTTKSDARKLHLSGSVSTIIKVIRKPDLENYFKTNLILSALTFPNPNNLTGKALAKAIIEDADAMDEKARQLGRDAHASIELAFKGEMGSAVDLWPEVTRFMEFWNTTGHKVQRTEFRLVPEFCGYGGTIDAMSHTTLFDFKTTQLKTYDTVRFWDDWCLQLIAYKRGLGPLYRHYRIASVAIPTDHLDKIAIKIWSDEEEAAAWNVFKAAHTIWCWQNKVCQPLKEGCLYDG